MLNIQKPPVMLLTSEKVYKNMSKINWPNLKILSSKKRTFRFADVVAKKSQRLHV